jgi:hypothetical protein
MLYWATKGFVVTAFTEPTSTAVLGDDPQPDKTSEIATTAERQAIPWFLRKETPLFKRTSGFSEFAYLLSRVFAMPSRSMKLAGQAGALSLSH